MWLFPGTPVICAALFYCILLYHGFHHGKRQRSNYYLDTMMVLINSIWFPFYLPSWKGFHVEKSGSKGNSLWVSQPPYQPSWLLANSTTRWLVLGQKIVPTEQLNASHCCRLTAVDNPSMYSIFPQSQIYIPSPQVELDNYGDGCRHLGGIGSYSSDDSAT